MAANDVTSYLPSQKEWGPDRDNDWPKIEDNVLHRFERDNYPVPEYTPAVWYDRGRVVLDPDNHPILRYEVLPATLSSALSGRDMEAMKRLDLRISRKDFRARMPRTIFKKGIGNGWVEKPLYSLSTIGMRTDRFRKANGLISWTGREGSDNIRSYVRKSMPRANILTNSTQGMPVPTLFEQEDSRTSNKGKHLNRAGRRALSGDTRRGRAQKENERLQRLLVDHIEVNKEARTQNDLKRKREEAWLDDAKDLQEAKRTREHFALLPPWSTSALALPPQVIPSPHAQPRSELDCYSVPRKFDYKRSRENAFSDDQQEVNRPLKCQKVQMVPDQPIARSTRPPRVSLGYFRRRAERNAGDMTYGGGFNTTASPIICASSTYYTIQMVPQQIRSHDIKENRSDDRIAVNVERSNLNNESVDFRLEQSIGDWRDEQYKVEIPEFPIVGNYLI